MQNTIKERTRSHAVKSVFQQTCLLFMLVAIILLLVIDLRYRMIGVVLDGHQLTKHVKKTVSKENESIKIMLEHYESKKRRQSLPHTRLLESTDVNLKDQMDVLVQVHDEDAILAYDEIGDTDNTFGTQINESSNDKAGKNVELRSKSDNSKKVVVSTIDLPVIRHIRNISVIQNRNDVKMDNDYSDSILSDRRSLMQSLLYAEDILINKWSKLQQSTRPAEEKRPVNYIFETVEDRESKRRRQWLQSLQQRKEEAKYEKDHGSKYNPGLAFFAENWLEFVRLTPEYDSLHSLHKSNNRKKNRGIVICGGGLRYIGSLVMTIQIIRKQNSHLPIEIFVLGGEQPTPLLDDLLQNDMSNVSVTILDDILPGFSALLRSYAMKIFAIVLSSFEEVLLLDSDAMPISKVDDLFNDSSGSQKSTFWPDFWPASVNEVLLSSLGVHPEIVNGVNSTFGSHDSGQMIINKRDGWDALMLGSFMALQSETIFPLLTENGIGIGDKEVLPVCFKALQIDYARVKAMVLPLGFVSDVEEENRHEEGKKIFQNTSDKRHSGEHNAKTIFHGTTMAQFHPRNDSHIAILHKNCEKWMMGQALSSNFLTARTWTHFKHVECNRNDDCESTNRNSVVALEPRPPRLHTEASVCETDVDYGTIVKAEYYIPDINVIEADTREIVYNFATSEAYEEYERWRILHFHEKVPTTENRRESQSSSKIPRKEKELLKLGEKGDGNVQSKVNEYEEEGELHEAVYFLQSLREKLRNRKSATSKKPAIRGTII